MSIIDKNLKSVSYKAGQLTIKYWYILVIIFIIFIFYPADYMNNCVQQVMQKSGWNESRSVDYCARYKRNYSEEFKYWKGFVYQK